MPAQEIWKGDLLNRRTEAELLIGYIECMGSRVVAREDGHAQTIAIDAGYGEGKSYFLRRLGDHLALNHPVAFVDAWADDLADDPLTAIAATLDDAFAKIPKSPKVQRKWTAVRGKIGAVAKIVATGAAKRAISLVITSGAAEAASSVLKDASESVKESVLDDTKSLGGDVFAGAENALSALKPDKLMNDRIEAFRAGRAAVESLKSGLNDLVQSLDGHERHRPVVVIIDELDRCRPTYAIKLLEAVKHLFDVQGIVFVLGIHSEQLAHSVQAAYGPSFGGAAYLRRFIGRTYELQKPSKWALVKFHLAQAGLSGDRFFFPTAIKDRRGRSLTLDEGVAWYVDWYEVSPRDIFRLVDILQTCAALTGDAKLLMPYLLPLIVSKLHGNPFGTIANARSDERSGAYTFHDSEGRSQTASFAEAAANLQRHAHASEANLNRSYGDDYWAQLVIEARESAKENSFAHPRRYPNLLEAIGRFSNPSIEGK